MDADDNSRCCCNNHHHRRRRGRTMQRTFSAFFFSFSSSSSLALSYLMITELRRITRNPRSDELVCRIRTGSRVCQLSRYPFHETVRVGAFLYGLVLTSSAVLHDWIQLTDDTQNKKQKNKNWISCCQCFQRTVDRHMQPHVLPRRVRDVSGRR